MKRQSLMVSTAIGHSFSHGWRGFFARRIRDLVSSSIGCVQPSRPLALGWFLLALLGCLLTAQGAILEATGSARHAGPVSSVIAAASFRTGGLGGLVGVLVSVGCGLAGFWCWPRAQRTHAVPQGQGLAAYDQVTGLPTIRLFGVLLEHAAEQASDLGRSVGVLVVELSHFRPDSKAGTPASVTLVARVEAARIKSALQSRDTVAYLGGQRFAVLIETVVSGEQIRACADRIQRTLSLPLLVSGQEVVLSCRIGSAMLGPEIVSGEALLAQAVQSLTRASSEHPIHFSGAAWQERPGANSASPHASRAA